MKRGGSLALSRSDPRPVFCEGIPRACDSIPGATWIRQCVVVIRSQHRRYSPRSYGKRRLTRTPPVACCPKGPSSQYLRTLVPKPISLTAFGTRVLKHWPLGPSGLVLTHRSNAKINYDGILFMLSKFCGATWQHNVSHM